MTVMTADTMSPWASLSRETRNRALVRRWLYAVLFLLFALVLIGGATRLTDSGLSITEWKPIHGVIPPLSDADWQAEFGKYKQIPEFSTINPDMDLAGFKTIFWWEWGHRFLARLIGVAFAVPFAFFWATGRIESRLAPKLLGILALGGLQGFIGWWMVSSGLVDRVDVSQYRLAIHLTLAALIFSAVMAVARGLAPHSEAPASGEARVMSGFIVAGLLVQIFFGGIVAGLDAGLAYNTWPLMGGAFVPQGLFVLDPAWRDLFETPKTAQFVHRAIAYGLLAIALWHMIAALAHEKARTHARRAVVLFALVLAQAALGVTALLLAAPLHAALAHQAMALIVLAFAVAHWRGTKGSYPPATTVVERH
ncbi:MAG: COX15/CtaA family protein [Phyllobacteriaceae bacterium]|nr:COX15/CtaA family protein [Phyllobacteriaceae bacterium]